MYIYIIISSTSDIYISTAAARERRAPRDALDGARLLARAHGAARDGAGLAAARAAAGVYRSHMLTILFIYIYAAARAAAGRIACHVM